MPWHCPACQSIIRHDDAYATPLAGERYRCHVCRLTLAFVPAANKLMITTMDADHHVEPEVSGMPRPSRHANRQSAGASVDVTRVEHENVYSQVQQNLCSIRRLEHELHDQRKRIEALERDMQALVRERSKGA